MPTIRPPIHYSASSDAESSAKVYRHVLYDGRIHSELIAECRVFYPGISPSHCASDIADALNFREAMLTKARAK